MPREFLPLKRRRESRGKAELFPRTEARVMTHPPEDRMVRRCRVKETLREMAQGLPAELEHVTD